MSSASDRQLPRQLPETAAELLKLLDEKVARPVLTDVAELSDEEGRLRLAEGYGRRRLVDQLLGIHNKQTEV